MKGQFQDETYFDGIHHLFRFIGSALISDQLDIVPQQLELILVLPVGVFELDL